MALSNVVPVLRSSEAISLDARGPAGNGSGGAMVRSAINGDTRFLPDGLAASGRANG